MLIIISPWSLLNLSHVVVLLCASLFGAICCFSSYLNHTLLQGKGDGVAVEKSGLNDNWDDAEGYYGMCLTINISGSLCLYTCFYNDPWYHLCDAFGLVKYLFPGKRCFFYNSKHITLGKNWSFWWSWAW